MPVRARLARSIARAGVIAARPPRPSLPRVQPGAWLSQLVPTRRSLGVGLGVLAVALGGYLIARETSLFAVDRIEVTGASPRVAGEVRQALGSVLGRPLVGLDGSAVLRKVDALPTVVRASYDRAFPHTLRITVVPEIPAAVLRRGPASWLVSARGRVMEPLPSSAVPRLPRIWLSTRTPVRTGAEVGANGGAVAARAVGLAGAFAARVASASDSNGALVFRLRSGVQLLLGDAADVKLKVAVAARVLAVLPSGSTYLDVSSPGRPVSGIAAPQSSAQQSSAQQSSSRG
jgi:cell division protein FtsQ